MNKINILIIACMAAVIASCNDNAIFEEELYQSTIYLQSGNNSNNVYDAVYTLNETNPVQYLSVGCGGTQPNGETFTVELEPDRTLLPKYNKSNFDIDTAAFARVLSPSKYRIESMSITFQAGNTDQYVKVPITVTPLGLSPDSIYFIPLAIKSFSKYRVNPEKSAVLYRVSITNDYADQLGRTTYYMRGSENSGATSGAKPVFPLSKDEVRLYAGSRIQTDKSTPQEIKQYSVILKVNTDQTVTLRPYTAETMQVEMLTGVPKMNIFFLDEFTDEQRFALYYRYRTLKTPASGGNEAVWNNWVVIQENLRRML